MSRLQNRAVYTFLSGVLLLSLATVTFANQRPRIGLALSGGGALGLAHIGVLQQIDSLDIPIDYIAGTSMGGIIGGLYAIGYSGEEIEKLVDSLDWPEIFRDAPRGEFMSYAERLAERKYQFEIDFHNFRPVTSGLIDGHKIQLILSRLTHQYMTVSDFDQLPVPFRCIAVDLNTGREVILGTGSLPKAMRATMSIPSIFTPVQWGDSLLIDGGLLNNMPTEVVREMGADIVIASAVVNPTENMDESPAIPAILSQSFQISRNTQIRDKLKDADIFFRNDLPDYTMADFSSTDVRAIVSRGKVTAKKDLSKLTDLQSQLELDMYPTEIPANSAQKVSIDSISIHGNLTIPDRDILELCAHGEGKLLTEHLVNSLIDTLQQTTWFRHVEHEIIPRSLNTVQLRFGVRERSPYIINDIKIFGNQRLANEAIITALQIDPGDIYNRQTLEQGIDYLYSTGNYRKVTYDLRSAGHDSLQLRVYLREHSLQKVRLGVQYDNYYQLVPRIRFEIDNFLFPALEMNIDLAGMGYNRVTGSFTYRKPRMNYEFYPYLNLGYEDIPVSIYTDRGLRITSVDERMWWVSGGVGLEWQQVFNIQIQRTLQSERLVPKIPLTYPDTTVTPDWRSIYQTLDLTLRYNQLNNYRHPTNGIAASASVVYSNRRFLGSSAEYALIRTGVEWYQSLHASHHFHLAGFLKWGTGDLPFTKHFLVGGPDKIIGVEYDQLRLREVMFLRLDYGYEIYDGVLLQLIGNFAPYYRYHLPSLQQYSTLLGYGVGVEISSFLGPVKFIVAQGPQGVNNQLRRQTVLYVTAGYRF